MEAIGVAASLVQLMECALSIAKTSKKLYKSYKGASEGFKSFDTLRTSSYNADLYHLHTEHLPLHTQTLLATAIEQASEAVQQLRSAFRFAEGRLNIKDRLRWALLDKSSVEEAQRKLEIAKSTLIIALQLLDLRLSTLSQTSLAGVQAAQQALEHQMKKATKTVRPSTQGYIQELSEDCASDDAAALCSSNNLGFISDPRADERTFRDPASSTMTVSWGNRKKVDVDYYSSPWRSSGTASMVWDDKKTTYALSMRTRLPWWLGQRALALELEVRQYALAWSSLSFLSGCINCSGYVPDDSPIIRDCEDGDEAAVRSLMNAKKGGPNDRFRTGPDSRTARVGLRWFFGDGTLLAMAITSGNTSLVRSLIDIGADVNITLGTLHLSPLQLALGLGNVEISRLLISGRASLDHQDIFQTSVAHSIFFDRTFDENRRKSAHTLVEVLLGHGYTDFGIENGSGQTVLARAARYCSVETARLLIRQGVSVSLPPSACPRTTPLHEAAAGGRVELLRLLVSHGGDIHTQEALISAAGAGGNGGSEPAAVQYLIDLGANVHQRDGQSRTALHEAAKNGSLGSVRPLLKAGADVQVYNDRRCTPLSSLEQTWSHCLDFREVDGAREECAEALPELLHHGADPRDVCPVPVTLS